MTKEKNSAVILTSGGVGYEIKVAPNLFLKLKIGEPVKLFTYFHVREDIQELYGLESQEELSFFRMLVAISGVGPKSALHILALGSVENIKKAISRADVSFLTKVSGIGKKIAERIVVELKSKIEKRTVGAGTGELNNLSDVIDALSGMGYTLNEAREAVKQVKEVKNTSVALKEALKILNRR